MTTHLNRPKPLRLNITAAEYDDLENWLPLKLAELEHTEEHQQRLAWWQEYGIRGVEIVEDIIFRLNEHTDIILKLNDGFAKEELKPDTESKEQSNNSVLTTFSLLPLKHALEKVNQNVSDTEYNQRELKQLSIVAFGISVNVDLIQLVEYFPTLHELLLSNVSIVKDSWSSLANLTQLTQLEIDSNVINDQGAIALAKPLANLTQLTKLNLNTNDIGDQGAIALAKPLANLTQLAQLNLDNNNIGELGAIALAKPLANLTQLAQLNLDNNNIGEQGAIALAKPLASLTQLTHLDLNDNNIGELGAIALAKTLANLTQLTHLDLNDNYIGEQGAIVLAKPLANLTQLTQLNLDNNNIGELGAIALAKTLANLAQFTNLNLSANNIGEQGAIALAKPLTSLTQLIKLNLDFNDIGATGTIALTKPLANLTQLTSLELHENNINDDALKVISSALITKPKLEFLDLSNNPITNLTHLLPLIKRGIEVRSGYSDTGITLDKCPITTPPPEIVEQGREAILNYFEEREAQDTVKLREAKLLIVGEPGVGKTSLVRRLTQSKQGLPAESETTKGIDIEALNVTTSDGEMLKLNLWDFGGQEIYHSTHQFFLTKRSLYVLVDSSRTNDTGLSTGIHDERYRYWLDVVASLSERSPLLLFQNQVAGRSKYIDEGSIRGEYPNVQSSDEGDLKKRNAVNSLHKNIIHHAEQLPHIGDDIPTQWLAIREALATLADEKQDNRAHITLDEYLALYRSFIDKDKANPDEERKKALLLSNYFHDLGIFLHFQNEPALAKTVILQNTWATEAVFKVLDDEEIKGKNGRFNLSDCKRIWQQKEYQDMHNELLALLEKFEICYKLPSSSNKSQQDEWLTPQLLQEQPEFLKALQQNLQSPTRSFPVMRLHYQYQFLPRGIVSRLMVRMHNHVNDPAKSWNKGVLFELHKTDYAQEHNIENSSLLVQLTNKPNEIALTAFGPEAKTLQGIIAAALDELNNTFEGLKDKVEKLVPCICSECESSASPWFYKAKTLRKFQEKNRRNAVCEYSAEDVPVSELLEGLPEDLPRIIRGKGKVIFEAGIKIISEQMRQSIELNHEDSIALAEKISSESQKTSNNELQTITLFLASSSELKAERDAFHVFLAEQNDRLIKQGVYIELIRWEHFFDAVSEKGLQNEYNEKVRSSDIFVSLFNSKVGKYTEQEFDVALEQFKATQSPKIYTYFYNAPTTQGALNREDTMSLFNFQDKLKEQGHYYTNFDNINHLTEQFRHQLDSLVPMLKEKKRKKKQQKPKVEQD